MHQRREHRISQNSCQYVSKAFLRPLYAFMRSSTSSCTRFYTPRLLFFIHSSSEPLNASRSGWLGPENIQDDGGHTHSQKHKNRRVPSSFRHFPYRSYTFRPSALAWWLEKDLVPFTFGFESNLVQAVVKKRKKTTSHFQHFCD